MATVLIAIPLVGALLTWLVPTAFWRFCGLTDGIMALFVMASLGCAFVVALVRFPFDDEGLQYANRWTWFEDLGISYHVGLYGFSFWLIGLTIAVGAAAIAYAVRAGRDRSRAYYPLMLFLVASLIGVFSSQDLVLFYAFFEAMLIPIYILVGVWGGPNRVKATITFVIYTMAGSLLMLASVVAFGITQGTFDLLESGTSDNMLVMLGFLAAFAVKAPLLPFHGWLRSAYTESTPEVAALLSGVVSKAAVYGLIWIVLRHFPEPVEDLRGFVLVVASLTLLYGSILAFRQPDARGVIAYSSMGQMGLITLGVFASNDLGLDGAVLHSISHGLVSASLFLLAAMIETRTGTGEFARLGGMARGRPALATLVMVVGMFTLAVPGSANFAGEFAILAGVFAHGWGYAAVGALAIVLAAMYALRFVSAVLHRGRGEAVADGTRDLGWIEVGLVAPLVALLVALSVWPAGVTGTAFPSGSSSDTIEAVAP